jgi:uncharacterized repeat protein (TIGR03803 family)
VLYTFTGGTDGAYPYAGLVRDAAGNLYGTTYGGGDKTCFENESFGCGTVFKLDTTGKETVLHSFTASPDGALPLGGLTRDAAGNLYGTTTYGGNAACYSGCGTVFELDSTGKETLLYSFAGGTDGSQPYAGLVRDGAGNLYGTTYWGGHFGYGTVFKLDATGEETVLYSFAGADGANPVAGLIRDMAGNLYGTTSSGGTVGDGTVFELDPSGKETVLHSFAGYPTDGWSPMAPVIRDSAGNLYGTTADYCFDGYGCGKVFKLDPAGSETILHSFTPTTGGYEPHGGLVLDAAGHLFGTTAYGGNYSSCIPGCGTLFKLDASGRAIGQYSLNGDGNPRDGLIRDASGTFYGTTEGDGGSEYGSVFELTP